VTPRELFEMRLDRFGEHPFVRFMLDNGRDCPIGPETFAGPHGEKGQCYKNSSLLAFNDHRLTYVEGTVVVFGGVPIDHAWCVNAAGVVIDPTLTDNASDYYGVPFHTDYVRKACLKNGYYGLLDIFSAHKTLPKLIELGLEEGQQWLIEKRKAVKA
jgi:hypothetical protein